MQKKVEEKNHEIFIFTIFPLLFRFEEECTIIEEEECRTVYDDAWENKCELVNVTLPATNCREITKIEMETKYILYIIFFSITNYFSSKNIRFFEILNFDFSTSFVYQLRFFFLLFISNETT